MIWYRGSSKSNFKLEESVSSRYGFKALFFTDSFKVAELYAKHKANLSVNKKGYIYQMEYDFPYKVIDYNLNVTHSAHFRNLMFQLQKQGYKSCVITNAVDYPDSKTKTLIASSILILFDFQNLNNIKLLQEITP